MTEKCNSFCLNMIYLLLLIFEITSLLLHDKKTYQNTIFFYFNEQERKLIKVKIFGSFIILLKFSVEQCIDISSEFIVFYI